MRIFLGTGLGKIFGHTVYAGVSARAHVSRALLGTAIVFIIVVWACLIAGLHFQR
jgi:hypothetical protein